MFSLSFMSCIADSKLHQRWRPESVQLARGWEMTWDTLATSVPSDIIKYIHSCVDTYESLMYNPETSIRSARQQANLLHHDMVYKLSDPGYLARSGAQYDSNESGKTHFGPSTSPGID